MLWHCPASATLACCTNCWPAGLFTSTTPGRAGCAYPPSSMLGSGTFGPAPVAPSFSPDGRFDWPSNAVCGCCGARAGACALLSSWDCWGDTVPGPEVWETGWLTGLLGPETDAMCAC